MAEWHKALLKDRLSGFLLLSALAHLVLLAGWGGGRHGARFFERSPLEVRLVAAPVPDFVIPGFAGMTLFGSLPAPVEDTFREGPAESAGGRTTPAPEFAVVPDHRYLMASELDMQPSPLQEVRPDYPAHAVAHDLQGWVRLLLLIDETGRVRHMQVQDASPEGIFDTAALDAFRLVPFAPARRGGLAVKSRLTIKVAFNLSGQSSAANQQLTTND